MLTFCQVKIDYSKFSNHYLELILEAIFRLLIAVDFHVWGGLAIKFLLRLVDKKFQTKMHICSFDGKCVIKRNLRVWYFCRITKSIDFRAGVVMSSGSRLQPFRNFLQHLGGEGRRIRPSSFGNRVTLAI